jgi:flagella basal body P-ring formation protein FlgA
VNKAPALVAFVAFVVLVAVGRAAFAAGPAAPSASSPLEQQALSFVQGHLASDLPGRVEVIAGPMDARLRLAPCQQVQAYLTPNTRLWGKTRVGLRCTEGVTPWNIYLPVTVKVWGKALVMTQAMPAGQVLAAADVRETEVDLAEEASPALTDASALVGRVLARSVSAGQGVRQATLKARQWFAPGDTVRIRAVGDGYAVAGSGEAVTAGIEGQPARVRTESGRLVTGVAVAEHQLELAL